MCQGGGGGVLMCLLRSPLTESTWEEAEEEQQGWGVGAGRETSP